MTRTVPTLVLTCAFVAAAVRPVPPPGIAVPEKDRVELETGLARLRESFTALKGVALLPDVQIFYAAVRSALGSNQFFRPEEISRAGALLAQGRARAAELANGRAPWTTATGLVVRGYISRIDNSVQPYALVVPPTYNPSLPRRWRLDAWFHGRGETLSEVNFLYDRQRSAGEFTPANTFVLHLYGRYCNANKFAGEIDLFEALAAVKKAYPIDENRIAVRGFSMGGAATWHIAAHYPGEWAAAAPGAGFAETPEYLKLSAADLQATPWWERRLWHWYNAIDYAENFFNLPVVAYSGEIDRQKQAADIMARYMKEAGLTLRHVIGPQTEHRYHPESKVIIDGLIDEIVARGRDPYPRRLRFTTYTLRYNRMRWVVIDGLDRHWAKARIEAEVNGRGDQVTIRTSNVREFHFELGPGSRVLSPAGEITVVIDGQTLRASGPMTDGSSSTAFRRNGAQWSAASQPLPGLRKRHGLQGPIDDAFMDSFVFVIPTGPASAWIAAEQARAIREWKRQWRGDAQVRRDTEVTGDDIANSNLVLWGDPASNNFLARFADRLPVRWSGDQLLLGSRTFPAASHVPILIYPNPLNPDRYIVLNSGPTQREADYLSNALQVPRLPDYAVIDTTTPPDERSVGKIVAAGFFDEQWQLQPDDGRGR
ncbi:MAG TPA: prolyl oligopeptidase family serine peptidase [Bryobacteraceae bacterium]|nr:prolyl oligopeptidase family serine peptidase [Bryobacteraceae bacterium]